MMSVNPQWSDDMSLAEAWQRPAADDINPDALEYLLAPKRGKKIDPPWVKLPKDTPVPTAPEAGMPAAPAVPNSELIRLQTTIEVLSARLEIVANQLHDAHHEVGFVKAQLAAKDEQLKDLAEYRAKAAKAIVSDIEKGKLRARVDMLEAIVADFEEQTRPAKIDDRLHLSAAARPGVSMEAFITAFTIGFAMLVLMHLLS